MLIASNFGLCATVNNQTVVKAPDWVYIPSVKPIASGEIRRSYTPHLEGEIPAIVLEFISETEGGEYSINPHYPYGKWYFYEQILQVPVYGIFQPTSKIWTEKSGGNGLMLDPYPHPLHMKQFQKNQGDMRL